jgi:ammonia channel protein AmtB
MGFEPTIPTNEWLQTHDLDRAAIGVVDIVTLWLYFNEGTLVVLQLSVTVNTILASYSDKSCHRADIGQSAS